MPVNVTPRALNASTFVAGYLGLVKNIVMATGEALVVARGLLTALETSGGFDLSRYTWSAGPNHVIETDQSRTFGTSDALGAIFVKTLQNCGIEARSTGVHLVMIVGS